MKAAGIRKIFVHSPEDYSGGRFFVCMILCLLGHLGKADPAIFCPEALQRLVSEGPGVWVPVDPKKSRLPKATWARGVSGTGVDMEQDHLGAEEAMEVLTGKKTSAVKNVWLLRPGDKPSDLHELIGRFSNPMAIAGSSVSKVDPLSIDEFEDYPIGTLYPLEPQDINQFAFVLSSLGGKYEYLWAREYLKLMDGLAPLGIIPKAGSRGKRFVGELTDLWESKESHYGQLGSQVPFREIRRLDDFMIRLRFLLNRYSR